jgi:hypothetical protein
MKRLIGRTDMEDALKKLDKLTHEETRMAVAQNLKATHNVDERVRGVANTVEAIDNRVAGVDDRVATVDDKVVDVDDRVRVVDNKVAEVIDGTRNPIRNDRQDLNCSGGREAKVLIQQAANDLDQMKCSSSPNLVTIIQPYPFLSGKQLRESIHKWLSPPDPSKNHNIARETHHKKAAKWFFQGRIYQEWKSNGSLLWVHGKRSSCSASLPIPSDRIL